jgi:hypothetical protein
MELLAQGEAQAQLEQLEPQEIEVSVDQLDLD